MGLYQRGLKIWYIFPSAVEEELMHALTSGFWAPALAHSIKLKQALYWPFVLGGEGGQVRFHD